MNKKFRLIPNKGVVITAVVVIAFLLAWLVYTAVMLSQALESEKYDITIYVISLIALTLLLALTIILLTLPSYIFKPYHLVLSVIAFNKKISYSDILLIRKESNSGALSLYFKFVDKDGETKFNFVNISIKHNLTSEFVETALEKNDKIVYETFDKANDCNDPFERLS